MKLIDILALSSIFGGTSYLIYRQYNKKKQVGLEGIEFGKDGKLKKIDTIDLAVLGCVFLGGLWIFGKYGLNLKISKQNGISFGPRKK